MIAGVFQQQLVHVRNWYVSDDPGTINFGLLPVLAWAILAVNLEAMARHMVERRMIVQVPAADVSTLN